MVKYETVELPPVGDRKTGDKVRITDAPSGVSDLVASGALTEDLTPELAQALLVACAHSEDISKIDRLFEEDELLAIGVASGLRLVIIKRQQSAMKTVFDAFKVGGEGKAKTS